MTLLQFLEKWLPLLREEMRDEFIENAIALIRYAQQQADRGQADPAKPWR